VEYVRSQLAGSHSGGCGRARPLHHHRAPSSRPGSQTGSPEILEILKRHKYSLILTAHEHDYRHDTETWQGRSTVVASGRRRQMGLRHHPATPDGSLVFVRRDAGGNPAGTPWRVSPQ